MSELKTNKISTNDQNNVAIDNALGLKSYTTAQRDALTSVAGDMIYNSTDSKVQVHNGSAWEDVGAGIEGFQVEYLVVGGGGAGAYRYDTQRAAGAGGAGGFRNSTTGEESGYPFTIPEPKFLTQVSTNYTVTVGAGGTGALNGGSSGNDSQFGSLIISAGGGRGSSAFTGRAGGISDSDKTQVGSGGGGQIGTYNSGDDRGGGGSYGQGGTGSSRGGGGGAGGNGTNPTGGAGKSSAITGSSVTYATGGTGNNNATGAANTGDGGGSSSSNGNGGTAGNGKNGGSGIVALKWLTADATIGATRTGLTDGGVQTSGDYSYIVFTAGTGTITFS
jgi:hypothetical protein